MLKEKRKRKIISLIESKESVSVPELASLFDVSKMTIRRDLQELGDLGQLERTHGGAILSIKGENQVEPPLFDRMNIMATEKHQIAKMISELIGPKEMVFLGSGSTTTFIARELVSRDDITVVTNALTVMDELARSAKMTLIGVGGFLRRNEISFYGHFSEKILQDLHVDKVIMGMRGIHPRYGLTSDHPQELATDRAIMNTSEVLIIAADHTKIGNVASARVAPIESATMIVTTKRAPMNLVNEIERLSVKVIRV